MGNNKLAQVQVLKSVAQTHTDTAFLALIITTLYNTRHKEKSIYPDMLPSPPSLGQLLLAVKLCCLRCVCGMIRSDQVGPGRKSFD